MYSSPPDTSSEALKQLIQEGESETVEFKQSSLPDGPVAALISSFANAKGGIILFGIDENGQVVGIMPAKAKEFVSRIRGIAFNLLGDPITAGIRVIDGLSVVFAVIPPAPEHRRPVFTATGSGFVREGTTIQRIEKKITTHPGRQPLLVFVAMSFRHEEEPALVDYFEAMKRAAKAAGLPIELERIDLVEGDYEISSEILARIDACDAVICDFTLSPQNVYLEAGYARGKNKRLIQTARKGTVLEFDARNWRTIFYANATELENRLVLALQSAYSDVHRVSNEPG